MNIFRPPLRGLGESPFFACAKKGNPKKAHPDRSSAAPMPCSARPPRRADNSAFGLRHVRPSLNGSLTLTPMTVAGCALRRPIRGFWYEASLTNYGKQYFNIAIGTNRSGCITAILLATFLYPVGGHRGAQWRTEASEDVSERALLASCPSAVRHEHRRNI